MIRGIWMVALLFSLNLAHAQNPRERSWLTSDLIHGRSIAIGDSDGLVEIWDPTTKELRDALWLELASVNSMCVSQDRSTLWIAGANGYKAIRQVNLLTMGSEALFPSRHENAIASISLSADGKSLISVDLAGKLIVWETASRAPRFEKQFSSSIASASVHPTDSESAFIGTEDGQVHAISILKRDVVASWRAHGGTIIEMACSPDGNSLATVGRDNWVRIWDISRKAKLAETKPNTAPARVSWTPYGQVIVGTVGEVLVYDRTLGAITHRTKVKTQVASAGYATALGDVVATTLGGEIAALKLYTPQQPPPQVDRAANDQERQRRLERRLLGLRLMNAIPKHLAKNGPVLNEHAFSLRAAALRAEDQGDWKTAVVVREEIVGARMQAWGTRHWIVAEDLQRLVIPYLRTDRIADARAAIDWSVEVYQASADDKVGGLTNIKYGLAVLDQVAVRKEQGELIHCEEILRRGEALFMPFVLGNSRAPLEFSRDDIFDIYGRLVLSKCELFQKLGRTDEAIVTLSTAKAIFQKEKLKPVTMVPFLSASADVFMKLRDFNKAVTELLEISRLLDRRNDQFQLAELAICHTNLSFCYAQLGKLDESRQWAEKAIQTAVLVNGKDSLGEASTRMVLAQSLWVNDKKQDAIAETESAIRIRKQRLAESHPSLSHAESVLGVMLVGTGRSDIGLEYLARANKNSHGYCLSMPSNLSESEIQSFLIENSNSLLQRSVSPQVEALANHNFRQAAITWLANHKGLANRVIAERAIAQRRTNSPEVATIIKKLKEARERLAQQYQKPVAANRGAELEQLVNSERAYSKELGQVLGRTPIEWVEFDVITKAMPPGAVLIQFEYGNELFVGQRQTQRKLRAWTLDSAGKSGVFEIGLEAQLTPEIQKLVDSFYAAPRRMSIVGVPGSAKEARVALASLYQRILAPLESSISGYNEWIIAPTESLWAIPWGALMTGGKDSRHLITERQIRLVVSGAELVNKKAPFASGESVVFADPDFDFSETPAEPSTIALRHGGGSQFARLPGTAKEGELVAAHLKSLPGRTVKSIFQREATENAIKNVRSPEYLFFGTHGTFDRQGTLRASPLVRSALICAGANKGGDGVDDGVLSGIEVVNLNLTGTRIVFLSACETGQGETTDIGMGVQGLVQAFHLAGAQNVVATLWPISDAGTQPMVKGFWEGIAKGKSPAASLQQAQIAMLSADDPSISHPFYWAAFVLSGIEAK